MPYIDRERRDEFAYGLRQMETPLTPGELNYVITQLVWDYYSQNRRYQTANDVLGALEGAKLEFYRRIVGPYEDQKIQENGDVYV